MGIGWSDEKVRERSVIKIYSNVESNNPRYADLFSLAPSPLLDCSSRRRFAYRIDLEGSEDLDLVFLLFFFFLRTGWVESFYPPSLPLVEGDVNRLNSTFNFDVEEEGGSVSSRGRHRLQDWIEIACLPSDSIRWHLSVIGEQRWRGRRYSKWLVSRWWKQEFYGGGFQRLGFIVNKFGNNWIPRFSFKFFLKKSFVRINTREFSNFLFNNINVIFLDNSRPRNVLQ